MRILFISHSNASAGAPRALLNLVGELKQTNEIAVVLPSTDGFLPEQLRKMGIKIFAECPYRMTIYPKVLNPVKFLRRMYCLLVRDNRARRYIGGILDEFKPDIVHTNVGPLDLAFQECLKRGIPHVWHLREYQGKETKLDFFPSFSAFDRLIHSEGNYNVGITRGIADFYGFREQDRVIYDGVLPESYIPVEQQREPFFLFVGRLEPVKGVMTLLEAWASFQKNHPEFRLKIVGRDTGAYSRRCRRYASKNLQRVEFLGPLPIEEIYDMMSRCNSVVVPSTKEGFGFIAAEAMWHGALVLGRDCAGTKEQMDLGRDSTSDEVALRFDGAESLARQLEAAASSPEAFEAMRQRGRASAMRNFSVQKSAEGLENYFKDILLWQKSRKAAGE